MIINIIIGICIYLCMSYFLSKEGLALWKQYKSGSTGTYLCRKHALEHITIIVFLLVFSTLLLGIFGMHYIDMNIHCNEMIAKGLSEGKHLDQLDYMYYIIIAFYLGVSGIMVRHLKDERVNGL